MFLKIRYSPIASRLKKCRSSDFFKSKCSVIPVYQDGGSMLLKDVYMRC